MLKRNLVLRGDTEATWKIGKDIRTCLAQNQGSNNMWISFDEDYLGMLLTPGASVNLKEEDCLNKRNRVSERLRMVHIVGTTGDNCMVWVTLQ